MKEKYEKIISLLKKYQERTHANGYVLGISGGKDSTVVAKLLVDAVGKEDVLGVLMPNGKQVDIEDSYAVCKFLNINYIVINIEKTIDELIYQISASKITTHSGNEENVSITGKTLTNIPPRIRMTTLYTIAQSLGYLVAGTGNRSEQFIGWFTKWGDGACDINPIAHLTCSEVIELGDYLGLPYELVHKTPADGLTGKSDEENFGFTYTELDALILKERKLLSTGKLSSPYTELEKKILYMHNIIQHKFIPTIINE